ncbi:AraC family transcriptional regulator N-terminal domain-containing protein [Pacificispira sp.]|uniref:AraC family transcriptional regulator n=1 Tax=Pacificispira sp. TaxID=2888761 RepID=UPI003BAB0902
MLEELAETVRRYADTCGAPETPHDTDVPGLSLVRCRRPTPMESVLYRPLVCVVLQGAKETAFGAQTVRFAEGQSLIVSLDLPSLSRVVTASAERPYLALALELDMALIRTLSAEMEDAAVEPDPASAVVSGEADGALVRAMGRLFELTTDPVDRKILADPYRREVHFRLLQARHGAMLRRLARQDSHASRIARAVSRIRQDITAPIRISDLSRLAGMSPSSFHAHFKTVTATTPLQYQKDLRLLEARQRLIATTRPVTEIAYAVGYESPTQFSREYARKFGVPPREERMSVDA